VAQSNDVPQASSWLQKSLPSAGKCPSDLVADDNLAAWLPSEVNDDVRRALAYALHDLTGSGRLSMLKAPVSGLRT